MELSPEDIRKDKGKVLPKEFKIYIFFDDFCTKCSPYTTELKNLCELCKKELGEEVLDEWREVMGMINNHTYPSLEEGAQMFQGVDPDLIESTLAQPL